MNFDTILPPDETARALAYERWNGLAKPLGSLGRLETVVAQIAALTGNPGYQITKPVLLVYCADNGVVRQGVSQSDATVTSAVASALGQGRSTVNYMAAGTGCAILPVDLGIADFPGAEGVLNRRICNGTGDFTQGPAMDRAACIQAITVGMELVRIQKEQGSSLILTGEMGIGNTTTAAAVLSVLTGILPEQITGRGAGLSDAGMMRKIHAIQTGIQRNHPDPSDPVDVLTKVGGLDLAALCGTFLGGAVYRVPVVVDGLISAAGALCAKRICPESVLAMVPSHLSAEPAGALVLEELGLTPLITADLRLGEGSGAVAVLPLLQMALAVYHSGNTFSVLGIDAYTPQQEDATC